MQLKPIQPPQKPFNLATPDFLVMNGMAEGGRSFVATLIVMQAAAAVGTSKVLALAVVLPSVGLYTT
jgi:hypothetical protein